MSAIKVLITSQKGGVGKSTLSANLSAFLAIAKHKKVCLVDFDHQASSSTWVKRVPTPGMDAISCDAFSDRDPMTAILKMKHMIRSVSKNYDIVVADLTWVQVFPQSFILDFDFVLVPTSLSNLELNSTMEFVSNFSDMFNSMNRFAPKLVLLPTRLHNNRDYQKIFTQTNFPVRFMLSNPVAFDLVIQDLFGKQYIFQMKNTRISQGFAKVGNELAAVFDDHSGSAQELETRHNSAVWMSRKALNCRPTLLDQFSLSQRSSRIAVQAASPAPMMPQRESALEKIRGFLRKVS